MKHDADNYEVITRSAPPFFLAVNRGFYKGMPNPYDTPVSELLFTSNIRRATTFCTYEEAERTLSMLLTMPQSIETDISAYYAILCAPSYRIITSSSQAQGDRNG